jgi:hypothetical protein
MCSIALWHKLIFNLDRRETSRFGHVHRVPDMHGIAPAALAIKNQG